MRTPPSPTAQDHLPPMGIRWLTPVYDPLTRLLGVRRIHRGLATAADAHPGQRAVEIGCGTGNLALLVKAGQPEAEVIGLDPDRPALAVARRKASRRGLDVRWDVGSATELPYPDGSVDLVLSSLMLHHLPDGLDRRALAEVRRVLRPGGALHLADFGGSHGRGRLWRRAAKDQRLRSHVGGGLAGLLTSAGFDDVTETGRHSILGVPVTAYRAVNAPPRT